MSRRLRLPPPSIPALVFLIWSLVVPFGFHGRLLNTDGDLARHIRHGQVMLETGDLIRADPFSYTRPGDDFLGFEYGSQLALAVAHRVAGLPGVAVLATLLIAATYALLAGFLLRRGVDPLLAYLTTIAASVLGSMHWAARPHLFSTLGVVALVWLLERPQRRLWIYPVLFAIWANLHGGFVFGWILIGIYLSGAAIEWLARGGPEWRTRTRHYAAVLGLAAVAPVVNPHGVALHTHVIGFFGQRALLDNTMEFMSPDFHGTNGKLFLAALLIVFGTLTLIRRRPDAPHLLVILATTAFALIAQRNIPLFGVTALPLLAMHADREWRALPDVRNIRAVFQRDAARGRTLGWLLPALVVLCLVGWTRGSPAGMTLVPSGFDREEFPVEAVAEARSAGLNGRIFNDFVWGGYLLYAWPEQKVFIDGGTDFYGEALMREHLEIMGLWPGWRERLEHWNVELALVPPVTPIAAELARDSAWQVWYCDSTAVLLRRGTGATAQAQPRGLPRSACPALKPLRPPPQRPRSADEESESDRGRTSATGAAASARR